MTKDDRQFIESLISGLRQEMVGMKTELRQEMVGMDRRWDARLGNLKNDLGEQIRHNGILIEALRDDVTSIAEAVSNLHRDMIQVKGDVADIKETIFDYPILRETVKKHSRQLAKLQA